MKCKLSEAYLKATNYSGATLKFKDRTGTIIGESKDKLCWKVLWDGVKTPREYGKSYIDIIDNKELNNAL